MGAKPKGIHGIVKRLKSMGYKYRKAKAREIRFPDWPELRQKWSNERSSAAAQVIDP